MISEWIKNAVSAGGYNRLYMSDKALSYGAAKTVSFSSSRVFFPYPLAEAELLNVSYRVH